MRHKEKTRRTMDKKVKKKRQLKRIPEMVYLGILSLKRDGIMTTAERVLGVLGYGNTLVNRRWARRPLYTETQLEAQRRQSFGEKITFSIVTPLYNTKESFLREMIESVLAQTYPEWELCLADGSDSDHEYVGEICRGYTDRDRRVKYRKLDDNLGIAGNSNACIGMVEGDFISLLDHDDILHPAALHDVMEAVCREKADFVYTDEMIFRDDNLQDIIALHFKKDFAPDDLLGVNYVRHFTSFRRSLIDRCGGALREGYDGAQDHEFFLRLTDAAEKIVHVPKPLYYWRAHGESTAASVDNKPYVTKAGISAVRDYLASKGIDAEVSNTLGLPTVYRVSYPIPDPKPMVSIVIPNADHADDLEICVRSIVEKTTYPNYEIIIVENNSRRLETFSCYEKLTSQYDCVTVITWPGKGFNWSAINNYAVHSAASGEYVLLLNNDTEVITPEWIEEMMMYAQRPDVGVVGAMLYYPDDRIQHAGVIIGLGRAAGHVAAMRRRGEPGYMTRLCIVQNLSAVTGACMLMRKSVFDEVDGMDEEFAVGLNDIDFCLRLRRAGYLVLWTPFAELYHYESKSRGVYRTSADNKRMEQEFQLFEKRWAEVLEAGDPYYNPNFSLKRGNFNPR